MTRLLHKGLLLFSIAALLLTCTTYEFPESPYAKIETLPVANLTQEGVTFQGVISKLSVDKIIDHGFIFGLNSTLRFGDFRKISLGPSTEVGVFEHVQKTELYSDSTYYIQAYITTASYTALGEILSFDSKGGVAPLITNFLPIEATWGDTLTIEGEYFSSISNQVQVKFGTHTAKIITSTASTITCLVPSDVPEKATPILVTSSGKQTQSLTDFTFRSPILTSFSPITGTFEDIITLVGQNFSNDPGKNIVKLNNVLAEVLESTTSQLKIKVPYTITTKDNTISVSVNLQSSSSSLVFRMLAPIINTISTTEGFMGETIVINGNNFNPYEQGNGVFFGNNMANVLSATKQQLTVVIPNGIYKKRENTIDVNIAEQQAVSSQKLMLQDAWLQKDIIQLNNSRTGAVSFSIGNYGYIGLGYNQSNTVYNDFWKFDPTTGEWSAAGQMPGPSRGGAFSFATSTHAYVGGGRNPYTSEDLYDFWRFNPANNSWTQLADLPIPFVSGIGLYATNSGYVLLNTESENFWTYNPLADQWLPLADLNTYWRMVTGFVLLEKPYFYGVDDSSLPNELFTYSPITQDWGSYVEQEDNYIVTSGVGFSVSGKGYVANPSGLSRFDPSTFSFERISENFTRGDGASTFTIGNKVYIGYGDNAMDFWEWDLDYE